LGGVVVSGFAVVVDEINARKRADVFEAMGNT